MSVTASSISKTSEDHLGSIDALRGLAALYVLLYHLALIPQPNLVVPKWASRYVLTGGTGVTLFFIVSAFCLCLSMRRHEQEQRPVLRFYVRRVFRILPLFYVWIFLSWMRDRVWSGVTHSWTDVLLSVFFGFNFVPGKNEGFVWASWTLGVEMLFYLVFPVIYFFVNNWWKSLAFFSFSLFLSVLYTKLVGFLSIADVHRESFVRTSLLHQLPIFAFGMVTFFVFERAIRSKSVNRLWAFVFVGAALISYDALLSGRLDFPFGSLYWQGIIYGILLLGLSISPLSLLVNRFSRFYGEISYSAYLNHPTLVATLVPVYSYIYSFRMPTTFQYGLCLLLTLGLLTAISYFTYRLIEQPGMRWGSRVLRQMAARQDRTD